MKIGALDNVLKSPAKSAVILATGRRGISPVLHQHPPAALFGIPVEGWIENASLRYNNAQ